MPLFENTRIQVGRGEVLHGGADPPDEEFERTEQTFIPPADSREQADASFGILGAEQRRPIRMRAPNDPEMTARLRPYAIRRADANLLAAQTRMSLDDFLRMRTRGIAGMLAEGATDDLESFVNRETEMLETLRRRGPSSNWGSGVTGGADDDDSGPKKRKTGEERKEEDEVLQEEKDGSEPRANRSWRQDLAMYGPRERNTTFGPVQDPLSINYQRAAREARLGNPDMMRRYDELRENDPLHNWNHPIYRRIEDRYALRDLERMTPNQIADRLEEMRFFRPAQPDSVMRQAVYPEFNMERISATEDYAREFHPGEIDLPEARSLDEPDDEPDEPQGSGLRGGAKKSIASETRRKYRRTPLPRLREILQFETEARDRVLHELSDGGDESDSDEYDTLNFVDDLNEKVSTLMDMVRQREQRDQVTGNGSGKKLTKRQLMALARHSGQHTEKHMDEMIKLMLGGVRFREAHRRANKSVGK